MKIINRYLIFFFYWMFNSFAMEIESSSIKSQDFLIGIEKIFNLSYFVYFLCCFSLFWIFSHYVNWEVVPKGKKAVPTIYGWPFFGCLFRYSLDPTGFLEEARKKYGPIFGIKLAGRDIVLLSDQGAIRSYYRASEEILNADDAFKEFGFRQIPALQKVPELNKYLLRIKLQSNMSFFIKTFSIYLNQYLNESIPKDGKEVEIFSISKQVLQYAIISTFIGREVLDTKFMQEMLKYQDSKRKAISKTIILPNIILKNSWNQVALQRQKLVDELIPIVERKFGEALKNPEILLNSSTPHYIQFIIQYHLDNGMQNLLSSESLAQYLLGLIFGAFSNPAIATSQAVLFLLEKPELITKIEEEAHSILGSNYGKPSSYTEEVLQSLPFLDCCIRETLRLITHPMGTMRKAREAIEFQIEETGEVFYVPQGKFVGIPHNLVTTDGAFYSNPKEYDPSRFERKEHRSAPFCYIPFSEGRHACPGKNFALLAMKSFILQWIYGYTSILKTSPVPKLNFRGGGNVATRNDSCVIQFIPKNKE